MSAIAAVVSRRASGDLEPTMDTLLSAMPPPGQTRAAWSRGGTVLGVIRLDWESHSEFRGPAEIVRDGTLVVAADAALYYRDALVTRLRGSGVEPAGPTPSHLILAAYRAWGDSCVQHLEGDFAFVLVDEASGTLFAARDIFGRRGLYYAALDNALVLASTISGVVAHPSCPRDLDGAALVRGFSFMMSGPEGTPYRAVRSVPPASCLTRGPDGVIRVTSYWSVPDTDESATSSFDDARLELRELLTRAVAERLAPSGPTALWLSGGYDSPALFAAGKSLLRAKGEIERLRPVSVSFPPGDPGREDELIEDIARYWGEHITWLQIEEIPLLQALEERAAAADQPSAHAVESFFGGLFRATRALGARVALQADGGDQLFAISHIFLSDLFAQGRWRELRREWLAFGGGGQGFRFFFDTVVQPVLTRAIAFGPWARKRLRVTPPAWIPPAMLEQSRLVQEELAAETALERRCGTLAGEETLGSLSHPILPRVATSFATWGMASGVEMRTPLLDRRLVEFALRRPRSERASLGEIKLLLRGAGRELLPESVLTPRKTRTGMLTGYFRKSFMEDANGLIERTFRQPILADLGIVDGTALLRSWHAYRNTGDGFLGGTLFATLHTELWVRARLDESSRSPALIR